MKCPHCLVEVHPNFQLNKLVWQGSLTGFETQTGQCAACGKTIIYLKGNNELSRLVYPRTAALKAVSADVPPDLAKDYGEASEVLRISPKASAALSRRCLQRILRDAGYSSKDLVKQVEAFIKEPDPLKAPSSALRLTIDSVRNFGNFSAHPIDDKTTLQIVDVEPHEAEWCLEVIEECFEHFYSRPAEAKRRKAALDAKLAAAGKPPSQ